SQLTAKDVPELATENMQTQALLAGRQKLLGIIASERQGLEQLRNEEPSDLLSVDFVREQEESLSTLSDQLAERGKWINDAFQPLQSTSGDLQAVLARLKNKLAQQFELCLNGSLGFWIPLGLLAGWARSRKLVDAPSQWARFAQQHHSKRMGFSP